MFTDKVNCGPIYWHVQWVAMLKAPKRGTFSSMVSVIFFDRDSAERQRMDDTQQGAPATPAALWSRLSFSHAFCTELVGCPQNNTQFLNEP